MRAALVALLLLSGCWSVIPGYDPLGAGITQRRRDRDRRTPAYFYTWGRVPASAGSTSWSPLVGFVNGVVSVTLAPLSLVLVPVRLATEDDAPDEEGVIIIEEPEGD